jgi:hypothetical protein
LQLLQSQEPGGQVQGLHVHCAAALRLVVDFVCWRFVFDFIVVNSFVVGATGFEFVRKLIAFHKG